MPWRGPEYPGEVPTLGWYVLEWMAEWLVVPDDKFAGEPLVLTPEQAQFVLDFYALDPVTGQRRVRRGIYSRPKGAGKSPLVAGLCLVEALAEVVPDGWDSRGDPVGTFWRNQGFKPKVQLLGVSEDQTQNAWDPLLDMIRMGPLVDEPGVVAMDTFVVVPRGRIAPETSSAPSREGFRPVFSVMDQTESWLPSNGGIRLAGATRRAVGKTGGSSIETPNSFTPGSGSVSERSFKAAKLLAEGRLKTDGILLDHREAPAETDMADRESLYEGLRWAYGCSADAPCALAEKGLHAKHGRGWVDLNRKIAEIWDPDTDPADSRQYYLNQVSSPEDAWLAEYEWTAARIGPDGPERVVSESEPIVLGFDGSKGKRSPEAKDGQVRKARHSRKADATALVACTVRDGYVWPVRVWEHPDNVDEWDVPRAEVEAEVSDAFRRWNVVGMYADPARWESHVAQWEARYGSRLKVRGSAKHPIEWWMTGGRSGLVSKAIKATYAAITSGALTHGGSAVLTRHVLHARLRRRGDAVFLAKEHPDSADKIDAAVAMVLAWQARLDAVAAGIGREPERAVLRRLR